MQSDSILDVLGFLILRFLLTLMLMDYFSQSFISFAFIMCEALQDACVRVQKSQEGISSL